MVGTPDEIHAASLTNVLACLVDFAKESDGESLDQAAHDVATILAAELTAGEALHALGSIAVRLRREGRLL